LFTEAGIVAPRCNHARVTVNGVDLGIYSNIEPIKKPFLARHFSDEDGNLYEGNARADFTVELSENYERKTNEFDPEGQPASRDDLEAVIQALEAPDATLYEALDQVIEMDSFMTFWAMEVLTGHWDGCTGNRNNHYIYADPSSGKFHFMPWGTDGAFSRDHVFLPQTPPSVFAWSVIAHRLYAYPPTRDLYRQRLQQLLDALWAHRCRPRRDR
jgi:spore coat protein CotH